MNKITNFVKKMFVFGSDQSTHTNYSDVILINSEGKFLTLLRANSDDFQAGKWCLAGGKIDEGESPAEAAVRELEEETGIQVDINSLEKLKTITKDNCTINYFIASYDGINDNIILDSNEHQGYEWILPTSILEKDFLLDLGSVLSDAFGLSQMISETSEEFQEEFNDIQPISLEDKLEKSLSILNDSLNNNEITDEFYLDNIRKINIIKSNFKKTLELRTTPEGKEYIVRKIPVDIVKSENSDDLDSLQNDFEHYVNTGFYYNDRIFDNRGIGMPFTSKQIKDFVSSSPNIYTVDCENIDRFVSNKPVLEGIDRYRFNEVLPTIKKYEELYYNYENELKERLLSSQNDFKSRSKDIKKSINTYINSGVNTMQILDYIKSNFQDDLDPLLLIKIKQKDDRNVTKQAYLSELKNYISIPDNSVDIVSLDIADIDSYGDREFKIDFFNSDDSSVIQQIHQKVISKMKSHLEFKENIKKAFDEGIITEEDYLQNILKAKQYQLVKVERDGKIFYQNRLVGTNDIEEIEVGGYFEDNQTNLEVKRYTDKSFLITGNTYKNIDLLRKIKTEIGYGTWNKSLNGWVFPYFAKDKIFEILASKMEVDTYESTIEKENVIAIKNAVDINTPAVVDNEANVITGIEASNGLTSYEVEPVEKPQFTEDNIPEINDEEVSDEEKKSKRGRKEVPIGTISKDGKFVKTATGWDYIKKKKTEKEIGIPAQQIESKVDEIINNVTPETRVKAGKELFGKEEGVTSIADSIENENYEFEVKVSDVTTRSGVIVSSLDYSNYQQKNIQLVDQNGILERERPNWCPAINQYYFYGRKDDRFVFDYVKLDDNRILLSLNGFEKKMDFNQTDFGGSVENPELKDYLLNNKVPYEQLRSAIFGSGVWMNRSENSFGIKLGDARFTYDNEEAWRRDRNRLLNNQLSEYAVVTLDQLVAISDYYTKYRKAEIQDTKEKGIERILDKVKEYPQSKFDYYKAFDYNRLSAKQKKQWTKEEWESLSQDEKIKEIPNMSRPFVQLPSAHRIKQLSDNLMSGSNFKMYKQFVNNSYTLPTGRYFDGDNDAAAIEYKEVREFLQWRKNDMNLQREENVGSYAKGLETSYGDSNAKNDLLDEFGVKVKLQNGKEIKANHIEDIREALGSVYKSFGNRSSLAKKSGLKISHSGEKLMFARQALGLYVPSMNAIGVSNNQEHGKFGFTLAHEFAHFIDNRLGVIKGRNYATDDYNSTAAKIAIEFRKNMNKATDNDYLNRTCECFARAMEQYHATLDNPDAIKSKKIGQPYHSSPEHVSKTVFETKIKPLIEQFFSENDELLKSLFGENNLEKADASHGGKLTKKQIVDKTGKQTTKWVNNNKDLPTQEDQKKINESELREHAKNSSLEDLEKTIKTSSDEQLRKIAHEEIKRREEEEHIKDEEKKDVPKPKENSRKKGEPNPVKIKPNDTFKGELVLLKNTEKAPNLGTRFAQDVEPAGFYAIQKESNYLNDHPNYKTFVYDVKNPLIIDVSDDVIQWKRDLSAKYKAKGKALTNKLIKEGYDAIITTEGRGYTGEIIILDTSDLEEIDVKSKDIKKSEDGGEITILGAKPEILKGCLMFFPKINLDKWKQSIDSLIPKDITIEYEYEPHITILYGFDDAYVQLDRLKSIVNEFISSNPLNIKLEPISLFSNDNDVVKIGIKDVNGNLTKLNEHLRHNFKYENNFPDYKPHMTLAYVRKGEGDQFKGINIDLDDFGFLNLSNGKILYSNPNKEKTEI